MPALKSILHIVRYRLLSKYKLQNIYPQYEIGRGSYGKPKIFSWGEGADLKIGAFCSIASGVKIYLGGEHRIDWVTTFPFNIFRESGNKICGHPKTKGDVIIGNDVWIGTDAVIMSGAKIGDGAVIGARAVVSKNVEPFSIYAGNPACFIRKRFDESTIQQMLELRWWEFDDAQIDHLIPHLLNTDVQAFIREAKRIKRFDV